MIELKEIIARELIISPSDLHDHFNLFDAGGMDSLDTYQVMMEIEETFKIHIPDSALQTLQTYGQLEKLVIKLIGESK